MPLKDVLICVFLNTWPQLGWNWQVANNSSEKARVEDFVGFGYWLDPQLVSVHI